MAVIKKDRTPFRMDCASFSKRYANHEAARLIAEAERIIEELEEQVEDLAARQPVGQEPMAWATHHDEPMLFPTFAEAAAYCDDDERPIALFTAAPAAVPVEVQREVDSLLSIWQSHFDSGVRPDEEDEPEGAALWDRIASARRAMTSHPEPAAPAAAAAVPVDVQRDAERFRILMSNYVQRWKDSNTGAPSSANFCFECKGWAIDKALDDEVRAMAAQPQVEGVGRG